jgi:dipeptidase
VTGPSAVRIVATAVAVSALWAHAGAGQVPPDPAPGDVHPLSKSIAIYVGRDLTADGSVLLGGFGHEPSSHWIEIAPRTVHPEGAAFEAGITEAARIPGERIRVPQVRETLRYITTNYSEFAGFPPPLTNGGLNERHLAARDVWSPSRAELLDMTPVPQRGLNYSDLSRIVMERAGSAREAVEIVGALIDDYGYATYGGNSHLFADADEGWVFINFAGGQGLWAAERLGPGAVRVSYPGYIGDFPVDFQAHPDYRGSANLVEFAVEKGWWDPQGEAAFNLQRVYGQPFPSPPGDVGPEARFRYPPELEEEIAELAPVSLEDMLALVRDPRWSDDAAGYGQVAHLRRDLPSELGVLWMSITGAVASPFVPVHVGVEEVPPEYKQHRYMTKEADSRFLDPDFGPLEATRSAFRVHKRLLYHTCENPEAFLRPVTGSLEAFEARAIGGQAELEGEVRALLEAGEDLAARQRLTEAAEDRFLEALALGESLLQRVEAETRERLGIRMPVGDAVEGVSWRPESQAMALRPGRLPIRCWIPGLDDYPRAHGSYLGEAFAADGIGSDGESPGSLRAEVPSGSGGGPGWFAAGLLMLAAGVVGGLVGWRAGARPG